MPSGIRKTIDFNATYQSNNCGPFRIIKEVESKYYEGCIKRMVQIQFTETGTIREVELLPALKGSVVDPYAKNTFGVGYLGELNTHIQYTKKEYDMWRNMMSRCYNQEDPYYHSYGAIGVRVDEHWHNFTNFITDLPSVVGYSNYLNDPDKSKYHLDKDIMQQNIPHELRVYSKDTCILTIGSNNSRTVAVDNRRAGRETSSSYYGLYKTPYNTYQCTIMLDGVKYFLGTYKNEIAAANVYNFVASNCCYAPTLNDVQYMSIEEALKYLSGRKPPNFPPNININFNNTSNNTSQYIGVWARQNDTATSYVASYCIDKNSINIGTFDDEIAAANAHNFYARINNLPLSSINQNIPYMSAAEWLQHRNLRRGEKPRVEMCTIVK